MEPSVLVGIIFMITGLFFIFLASLFTIIGNKNKKNCDTPGEGEVIELVSPNLRQARRSAQVQRQRPMLAPLIRYYVNGTEYTYHPKVYTYPCKYNVGDRIKFLYDSSDPSKIHLNAPAALTIISNVFYIVGGILTCVGFILKHFG